MTTFQNAPHEGTTGQTTEICMNVVITDDILTREDLAALITAGSDPAVSIYMPTHRAGAEIRQDPIRFKHLLQELRRQLRDGRYPGTRLNELLEPVQPLVHDHLFWRNQADGLAVFLATGRAQLYRIPVVVPELFVVADAFHIKPLLPLVSRHGTFFILALSQQGCRLLEGTRYGVRQWDIPELALSLDEALPYDDPEKQMQFHTGTSPRVGKRDAIHHGQGLPKNDLQNRRSRYCRFINKTVSAALKSGSDPLVLAADKGSARLYREVNTCRTLLDKQLEGNFEHLSNQELWKKCIPLVEDVLRQEERACVNRYRELAHEPGASNDLKHIAAKAAQGAVEALMVEISAYRWGRHDPDSGDMVIHETPQPGDRDLLDAVAGQVLLQGGQVIGLERDQMPDESPVAAIFRF